jgi:hypothetical protein
MEGASMKGRIGWSLLLMALMCVAGCSEQKFYPVRGKVVVYGVGPLQSGEIRFRPKADPSLIASGQIQKDGSFEVSTPGHEGVLEGDCQVAILVDDKSGKRTIAQRYADFDAADLNFTIQDRPENWFQLDVKRN